MILGANLIEISSKRPLKFLAIVKASMYIDEEVNMQAKQKLDDIFGKGASDNL